MTHKTMSVMYFILAMLNVFLVFASPTFGFSVVYFLFALWFIYRAVEAKEAHQKLQGENNDKSNGQS